MNYQGFPPALLTLSPRLTRVGDPGASVDGVNTTTLADGALVYCLENKQTYRLDRQDDTTPPDGTTVIAPLAGPGRWKDLGLVGPQGPQGAAGPQGPQGAPGDSALETGANLTDADATVAIVDRRVLPAGTLSAARVLTLTPSATYGRAALLEIGTQGFTYTIRNGGPLGTGVGLEYVVTAGTRMAVWFVGDGSNVNLGNVMPLAAEPVP